MLRQKNRTQGRPTYCSTPWHKVDYKEHPRLDGSRKHKSRKHREVGFLFLLANQVGDVLSEDQGPAVNLWGASSLQTASPSWTLRNQVLQDETRSCWITLSKHNMPCPQWVVSMHAHAHYSLSARLNLSEEVGSWSLGLTAYLSFGKAQHGSKGWRHGDTVSRISLFSQPSWV